MKKFTKLFLVLGMVLLVGIATSAALFSEEPSSLEADLQKSMGLISQAKQAEYLDFYKKTLNRYSKDEITPFKILHLKYLYLTNNEKEFKNLLSEFPDDFVFRTYIEASGKQIEYTSMLKNKEELTKKDLVDLWQKIKELDDKVKKYIEANNYQALLEMVGTQRTGFALSGAYGAFEGVWAETIFYEVGCGTQTIMYSFLVEKEDKVLTFLIENFKNHDSDENLRTLVSKDIGPLGSSISTLFLDSKNLSKNEIESLKKAMAFFQKKNLSLGDYSYDKNSENYVFSYLSENDLNKWENNKVRIQIIKDRKIKSMVPGIVSFLSKNLAALYLGSSYGDSNTSYHFLIFKKVGTAWIPIIKHAWSFGGGC